MSTVAARLLVRARIERLLLLLIPFRLRFRSTKQHGDQASAWSYRNRGPCLMQDDASVAENTRATFPLRNRGAIMNEKTRQQSQQGNDRQQQQGGRQQGGQQGGSGMGQGGQHRQQSDRDQGGQQRQQS